MKCDLCDPKNGVPFSPKADECHLTAERAGAREELRRSRELLAVYDNLAAVQTRCTELLLERRDLHAALLLAGWFCPSPCGVFNGEMKEILHACRACDRKRPPSSSPTPPGAHT
jgi:hypothetical protein